jgi:hypothetical protein
MLVLSRVIKNRYRWTRLSRLLSNNTNGDPNKDEPTDKSTIDDTSMYNKIRGFGNSIKESAGNIAKLPFDKGNLGSLTEKASSLNSSIVTNVTSQVEKVYSPINNQIKFLRRISIVLVVIMSTFYGLDKITDICIKIKKIKNE